MIDTIYGPMSETQLERRDVPQQHGHAVEYRLKGTDTLVHRSAHLVLDGANMEMLQGFFSR